MADAKKTDVGTDKYFSDIMSNTIFSGVRMTHPKAFSIRIAHIAQSASNALSEIYEDIDRNSETIKFMSDKYAENVGSLADNLYGIKHLSSVTMKKSTLDVRSKLTSLQLKSGVSMGCVIKAAEDIVGKNPLKLSDTGRKSLVNKAVRFGLYAVKDKTQKDYLEALFKKYNKYVISAALDYLDHGSGVNKGKNGFILGSTRYAEKFACDVFGGRFVKSSQFGTFGRSYRDGIKKQIGTIVNKLKKDVKDARTRGEYMEYDTREFMEAVMADLSRYVSGNPTVDFKKDILKLRRLEDYDN